MYVVFYAHPDDAKLAELLADYLDFGNRTPLQSIRQLVEGQPDVRQAVRQAFSQSDLLVVLISPSWLRANSPENFNPGAVENVVLKAFLQRDKPVIPVLLKGVRDLRQLSIHQDIDRLADIQTMPLNLEDALATIQAVVQGTLLTGKSVMDDPTSSLEDTRALSPVQLPGQRQSSQQSQPEREHSTIRRVTVFVVSLVILILVAYGAYLVGVNEGEDDDDNGSSDTVVATELATEAATEPPVLPPTLTSTIEATETDSPTETVAPSDTPTLTPSATDLPTDTPGPTDTYTPSATNTPSQTQTPSASPSLTPTETPTPTATATATNTPQAEVATEVAAVPDVNFTPLTAETAGDAEQITVIGRGEIEGGTLSSDGTRFVANTFAGAWVYNLEAEDLTLLAHFPHTGPMSSAALSPNGIFIATGGFDRATRILNADTGQLITDFTEHDAAVNAITFSADSQLVASAGENIYIYPPQENASVRTFAGHRESVNQLAFSDDGTRLASADTDGNVVIWDVASGNIDATLAHAAPVNDLEFAANNAFIIVSTDDNTVRYWDIATSTEIATLENAAAGATWLDSRPVALRRDSDGEATFIDLSNGSEINTLIGVPQLDSVIFNTNGQAVIIYGDSTFGWLPSITDMVFFANLNTDHTATGTRVATAPNKFLIGALDGRLLDFGAAENNRLLGVGGAQSDFLQVAYGDDVFGGIYRDGSIRIYTSVSNPENIEVLPIQDDIPGASTLDFNLSQVALGSGGGVFVIDAATGETVAFFEGPPITAVSWSPNEGAVAATGSDGTVRVWDLSTGTERFIEEQSGRDILTIDWSRNDIIAAAGRDNNIVLRDAQSGTVVTTYDVGFVVERVAFSPNGQLLAVASQNPAGTVLIFEVSSGSIVAELEGHVGFTYDVAWSSDGGRLYTTGQDNTVRVWGTE